MDVSCATCASDGKCATCPIDSDRNPENTCTCRLGFFLQASACLFCDITCRTCSGSSPGSCLSCRGPLLMQGLSPNRCACNDGTFFSSQNNLCESCNPVCRTCQGATTMSCTSCLDNAIPDSGKCVCNVGYFMDGVKCLSCPSACSMCVSAIKCTKCTERANMLDTQICACNENSNWDAQTIKCSCANGYYYSTSLQNCSPCIANCVKCTGPLTSDCQSCIEELTPSALGCSCVSGMMKEGVCVACYPNCQTCTDQTPGSCLTCKPGLSLFEKTCVCPNDKYFNTNTSQCDSCTGGCQTCEDGGVTSCLTCQASLTLVANAPAACECVNEDSGCCNEDCTSNRNLPPCKQKCSPHTDPDPPLTVLEIVLLVLAFVFFLTTVIQCIGIIVYYYRHNRRQMGAAFQITPKNKGINSINSQQVESNRMQIVE